MKVSPILHPFGVYIVKLDTCLEEEGYVDMTLVGIVIILLFYVDTTRKTHYSGGFYITSLQKKSLFNLYQRLQVEASSCTFCGCVLNGKIKIIQVQ